MKVVATLWAVSAAAAVAGSAAAAEGSCLVAASQAGEISGSRVEPADERMSVIRPCAGRVRTGPVEVVFSTGEGYSQRAKVQTGEYVDARLRDVVGPAKQLVDIWPRGGMLGAVVAMLKGQRTGLSGTSGFESGDGVQLSGDVLPLPDTRIHLKLHGWDEKAPVQLAQASWSATVAPADGVLALPVGRLKGGQLRLAQGRRSAVLNVVPLADAADVGAQLQAINAQAGEAPVLAMQRALLLQEQQFQVNALSAFFAQR